MCWDLCCRRVPKECQSPTEWFVCDDEATHTRYFVIQVCRALYRRGKQISALDDEMAENLQVLRPRGPRSGAQITAAVSKMGTTCPHVCLALASWPGRVVL